jgi:membrane-bound lytic murein transglycosylase B
MPFSPRPRPIQRRWVLSTLAAATLPAWAAQRKKPVSAAAAATGPDYSQHDGARAFAAELSVTTGLPLPWLHRHIGQARRTESVRRLIMPPPAGTAKNWAAYRARFVEPQRVAAGLAFWRDHEAWLREAEERWGVPPEIVTGVIGVETFYGRITGTYRVIDALATLSFDFPPGRKDRSEFFRNELAEFLGLCARQGTDPLSLKGSYAGAMGLPQFMPSSINRWAVDMDGDGRTDLHGSAADAIGSVAHYLAAFGWETGLPTHHGVAAPVDTADRAVLLAPDIVPSFSAAQMAERGAVLSDAGKAHVGPLALVELQNGDAAPSYVAGTQNFWVVTRYNWSSYYAMAVIELGAAVATLRRSGASFAR